MSDPDIAANAALFRQQIIPALTSNFQDLAPGSIAKIDAAYGRLTGLQALRASILESQISEGALGFFNEAQGDGLTSQVLVSVGATRSALKSLRSLIENVVRSIYYADHAIEYELWEAEKHRPTFKSLFDYLEAHPALSKLDFVSEATCKIHSNWKKLSQAVHASAKAERMATDASKISLWRTTQEAVAQWANFQMNVLKDVIIIYTALYSRNMQGAALQSVRSALSLSVPTNLDSRFLQDLGVRIIR